MAAEAREGSTSRKDERDVLGYAGGDGHGCGSGGGQGGSRQSGSDAAEMQERPQC